MRFLRRAAIALAAIAALLILVLVLLLTIGVQVPLGGFRGELQAAASQAIGREVRLEGPIVLVPTLWPTFEIEQVVVADPPGWPEAEFARFALARCRLDILPLLQGRIHVLEITGKGIATRLRRRADGSVNWAFDLATAEVEEEPPKDSAGEDLEEPLLISFEGADELSLDDIRLRYENEVAGTLYEFEVHHLDGAVALGEPTRIEMKGAYQGQPYTVEISGGPFDELFDTPEPWPFAWKTEVTGTSLELEGKIAGFGSVLAASPDSEGVADEDYFGLRLSLKGERLDGLDPVAGIALPPFGPYSLGAMIEYEDDGYTLKDLALTVGSSELTGEMSWTQRAGEKPRAEVSLTASTIQLDDFQTDDFEAASWSLAEDAPAEEPAASEEPGEATDEQPRALLDPAVLREFEGRLSVSVGRVLSGRDKLGRGKLVFTLRDGRLMVDPFSIEVPGGSVAIQAAYEPRPGQIALDLGIQAFDFDYGIIARRVDSETDMKGTISLDVDLRSRAPTVESILQHANGYLDVALYPEDFEAGIFELWAVNLVAAILPTLDQGEGSKVDCVAALFDVKDGIMAERMILADTTRMRVKGTGEIDFHDEELAFVFEPRPKRPQFFNLATPVSVQGSFDDFGVGVRPGDLVGTVITFFTSVVVVPVEMIYRLAAQKEWESCDDAIREARASRGVAAPPPKGSQ